MSVWGPHLHAYLLYLREKILNNYKTTKNHWGIKKDYIHGLFFFFYLMFFEFLNFILIIFLYSRFLLVIYFIHISVYMSIPISQFITTPPPHPATFPPWCPYVCSLHLCLYFCPANRFICTIFLDSTYMY